MKSQGDPLADGVIRSFAGNGGAEGINVILDQLRRAEAGGGMAGTAAKAAARA